jgi:hypothetical protein
MIFRLVQAEGCFGLLPPTLVHASNAHIIALDLLLRITAFLHVYERVVDAPAPFVIAMEQKSIRIREWELTLLDNLLAVNNVVHVVAVRE